MLCMDVLGYPVDIIPPMLWLVTALELNHLKLGRLLEPISERHSPLWSKGTARIDPPT